MPGETKPVEREGGKNESMVPTFWCEESKGRCKGNRELVGARKWREEGATLITPK